MQITGNSIDTRIGPKEWFTRAAYEASSGPHVTDEQYGPAPSIEEA